MADIIRIAQHLELIIYSVTSHSFCPVFGHEGCPLKFWLLCNMLNVYITLYETGPYSSPSNEFARACFVQVLQ